MKISKVTPLVLGTTWRNLAYFKVETDEGLVGYGDARALNKTQALLGYMAEAVPYYVLGHDPFNVELLVQRMMREDYARAGEVAMTGIAVIEMACWDIMGKALNQPVYRLLGGAVRDKIKVYANGWYRVERTANAFHAAAKKVLAKGYRALKFDPFGASFYEFDRQEMVLTVSLVEAVRDAVGPDVLQPDITHFGGLLSMKKLAGWADAYYMLMAPHNVAGPVATAAAYHLAATTTNFMIQENFNDFDAPYVNESAPGLPPVVDGYVTLPEGPGLGVTLDEDVIAAYPGQALHFNLFQKNWHKRDMRDSEQ